MKLEFFPKLAMDGIRKNKRLYTPYILACIGMVAMLYIITFLSQSPLACRESVKNAKGKKNAFAD